MRYREIIEDAQADHDRKARDREKARACRPQSRKDLKRALELVGIDVEDIDPTLNDPNA